MREATYIEVEGKLWALVTYRELTHSAEVEYVFTDGEHDIKFVVGRGTLQAAPGNLKDTLREKIKTTIDSQNNEQK